MAALAELLSRLATRCRTELGATEDFNRLAARGLSPGKFTRLAESHRAFTIDDTVDRDVSDAVERAFDLDGDLRGLMLGRRLGPDLDPTLPYDRLRAFVRAYNLDPTELDDELVPVRDVVRALDRAAAITRGRYASAGGVGQGWGSRSSVRVLGWLAHILPVDERSRFVAEAQGNLGDCEHWWQRVDHLLGLALGTPRLAWMMWRDGRRGLAE